MDKMSLDEIVRYITTLSRKTWGFYVEKRESDKLVVFTPRENIIKRALSNIFLRGSEIAVYPVFGKSQVKNGLLWEKRGIF